MALGLAVLSLDDFRAEDKGVKRSGVVRVIDSGVRGLVLRSEVVVRSCGLLVVGFGRFRLVVCEGGVAD